MTPERLAALEAEFAAACEVTNDKYAVAVAADREYEAAHAVSQRLCDQIAYAKRQAAK